jgi:hypothetical protein
MSITAETCGSGLAREGGVSGDKDVGCAGLFASKPAPTGSVVDAKFFIAGELPCATGFPAAPYPPSDLRRWAK